MTLYCEAVTLGKRFFGVIPLRMTSHRKGGMLGIRFFTSLRSVQNDNVPLLLSRRKEVTKKGRPLVIGYSCLPLRSPTGAAELAPLKQSSPYFRLLPRSRQPDKGGHFSSPTLSAIKGKGGSLLSFRVYARNPILPLCRRFFISLALRSE